MMACYSAAQSEKMEDAFSASEAARAKEPQSGQRIIPVSDPFHVTILERRLAGLKESTYNSGVRLTVVLPDWKRDADERGERGTTSELRQTNGLRARIMNYGGIVTSLETITDIVCGFDPLDGYLANPGPFFGALIGRYADRIGQLDPHGRIAPCLRHALRFPQAGPDRSANRPE
jgi:hypothetical protein